MRILLLFISLVCLFYSCQNSSNNSNSNLKFEKFDSIKWKMEENDNYLYRDLMIKDLIENIRLKGLTKTEILNTLGEPDRSDGSYLFYTVHKTQLWKLPVPLHTKTLVIKLTSEGTVEWRKIHE